MAQNTIPTLTNDTLGSTLDEVINGLKDNLYTIQSGQTRPAYAVKGMLWWRVYSDTLWRLNLYDGSRDLELFEWNPQTPAADAITWKLLNFAGIIKPNELIFSGTFDLSVQPQPVYTLTNSKRFGDYRIIACLIDFQSIFFSFPSIPYEEILAGTADFDYGLEVLSQNTFKLISFNENVPEPVQIYGIQ